ncbi:hypothetical protein AQUCO_00700565v1 [Aquilegia coerulea]|uniref:ubiquitinyl hydrolase 1 n=1 Tax=Aquilegia coerulea TaxID=218851 RepID=A0A2G5EL69_AQUCA|nr:hypothetical protein AQUCO_00700565v1 [Aquilegia coerulea]
MLVPGDLGFTGLVLVFLLFFFFGPIVSFLIQKKWRIAVEKKEEIMRLVAMASEEAARAEFEASNGVFADYDNDNVVLHQVSSSPRPFKCAVCYCPTTTRCSRCKLVRYCSGKCQIIHWRRGHKDECHPPSINSTHFNSPGSDCDQNVILQGEQFKCYEKDLELDSRWSTKSSKRFSKRSASSKVSLSPELRGDDTSCVSFSTSTTNHESDSSWARFSTSTISNESSLDVSVDEGQRCKHLSRSKKPLPNDVFPDVVENNSDVNETKTLPPEFTGSRTSVNNISFSSKLRAKISSCRPGVINCELAKSSGSCINDFDECKFTENSTCPSDILKSNLSTSSRGHDVGEDAIKFSETVDGISPNPGSFSQFPSNFKPQILEFDDAYPKCFGNKRPTDIVTPPENIGRNDCTTEIFPAKPSRSSDYVDNVQSNSSQLPDSKGRRSSSSSASDRHPSSGTRRSSTSSDKSTKVDNFHNMPTGLPELASSSPNTSGGLRTSVRKVVQQFKVPKPSKTNPFGLSEVAERNNYKMLFPYDLFIKLYNWGKIELRPSGLMNCGNSCYANAVLQCLAFTQPLTAYLLQGLHSRACPRKEWCFTCEFEFLIQKASEGNSPLSPIGILSQLQSIGSHLGHGKEEDAHEFLRYAIDTMQSVCLKEAGVYALSPLAEETTLVGLIFGGYLRSKIKCMKCLGKSERHERMMDLTVEIQGDIGTLEEALGKYTATEILDGENKYLCNRCKSYEKAKKKMTVLEAPNVLTIAFKRFQSGKFGKLNKSIRFPEILNLAPYMSGKSDKSPVYKLYGVVVHVDVMNAAFSGHYVCYVKNLQGKWFKIDDSTVKPVELGRVLSKGAYMLLYSSFKMKRDRSSEAPSNCKRDTNAREKFSAAALRAGTATSTAHRRPETYPCQMTLDGLSSIESLGQFNRRIHQINRVPVLDSSSDSSSLFSCSDEGSCSTESTRDSTSTDDLSDYIFGESRFGWNSPWRGSDDVSCSSPFIRSPSTFAHRNDLSSYETNGYPSMPVMNADKFSTRPHPDGKGLQEVEMPPFLYSDTSQNCRKLADRNSNNSGSNSSSETNLDHLGWGNPSYMKSGVSLRRPIWERTAQTF